MATVWFPSIVAEIQLGSFEMKALCFGEILWDVKDDTRTLGGAPLNVAGHISKLGGESYIISSVGDDELGQLTMTTIDGLEVDRRFVHISGYETGVAEVVLEKGIPSYAFNDPAAWDDIKLTDEELSFISSQHFYAVVYGTLASRHAVTRKTLFAILDAINSDEFFFDVNIRLSFYSDELIRECLKRATILKMNSDEIPVVASAIGTDEKNVIDPLFSFPKLRKIIVTCGGAGSYCHERGGNVIHAEAGNATVVNTVGAGDSLSAAFLYFSSLGYGSKVSLSKASELAEYVVTKDGAIPEYDESLKEKLLS